MAQSGHAGMFALCPLSRVKRTSDRCARGGRRPAARCFAPGYMPRCVSWVLGRCGELLRFGRNFRSSTRTHTLVMVLHDICPKILPRDVGGASPDLPMTFPMLQGVAP